MLFVLEGLNRFPVDQCHPGCSGGYEVERKKWLRGVGGNGVMSGHAKAICADRADRPRLRGIVYIQRWKMLSINSASDRHGNGATSDPDRSHVHTIPLSAARAIRLPCLKTALFAFLPLRLMKPPRRPHRFAQLACSGFDGGRARQRRKAISDAASADASAATIRTRTLYMIGEAARHLRADRED